MCELVAVAFYWGLNFVFLQRSQIKIYPPRHVVSEMVQTNSFTSLLFLLHDLRFDWFKSITCNLSTLLKMIHKGPRQTNTPLTVVQDDKLTNDMIFHLVNFVLISNLQNYKSWSAVNVRLAVSQYTAINQVFVYHLYIIDRLRRLCIFIIKELQTFQVFEW